MRIIMIRHPITKGNVEGIVQHSIEGCLDEEGLFQIEKILNRLKDEKYDKVHSSDAERCRLLADKIASAHSLQCGYNSLFREISNGLWSSRKKSEMDRVVWNDPLNDRPPQGESLADVWQRSQDALKYIEQRGGKRVILVSHATFLKYFVGSQLGMDPLRVFTSLKFSNGSISEMSKTTHGWRIEYLNNSDHL